MASLPQSGGDSPAPRRAWRAFAALSLAYLTLVTGHVLFEVYLDCHLYDDLGIYSEALAKLNWGQPNPYLSARHLTIFSDHFDPILWLAVPWMRLLPLPYAGVCFEGVFVLLGVAPYFVLAGKRVLSLQTAWILASLSLFNVGAMTAVHYPIHPTTWAMTPWVVMVVALDSGAIGLCVAAFLALLACKEEFPFVGLPLAWLLWQRQARRASVGVVMLAVMWLGFVYGVRPLWVGPIEPYYASPFLGLKDGLSAFLRHRLSAEDMYQQMGLCLLAFTPVLIWMRKQGSAPRWGYVLLCAPPMLIRFMHESWRHQYYAVTMAGIVAAYLPALKLKRPPRSVLAWTCVALVATNYATIRGVFQLVEQGDAPSFEFCPWQPQRQDSLEQARRILRQDSQARMLVGLNLLPKLVDFPHTFTVRAPLQDRRTPYRYVFFEKPPYGEIWPTSQTRIQRALDVWRAQADTQMLVDDAWVFCARGTFWDIGPNQMMPPVLTQID